MVEERKLDINNKCIIRRLKQQILRSLFTHTDANDKHNRNKENSIDLIICVRNW